MSSDRTLAAIVETSQLGHAVLDEALTFRYASPAMAEHLGVPADELVGRNGIDFIHPDDRGTAALAIAELITGPERNADVGVPLPLRVVRADGTTVVLELGAFGQIDHPDIRGVVIRTRSMRGQEHINTAMRLMAQGEPTRDVLAALVRAVEGIVEGGRGLVVMEDDEGWWWLPADVDPALALVGADGRRPALWERARRSGGVETADVDDLEPDIAAAARAAGLVTCWTISVPQRTLNGAVIVWHADPRPAVVTARIELARVADVVGFAVERDRAIRHLEYAASHDQLTGLANRATLHGLLEVSTEAALAEAATLGVLFVDLDSFKLVNDLYGHAVGDAVLREAAARIVREVRNTDTVARVGGDEFAVVCPSVSDAAEHEAIAERIVRSLERPFEVGGVTVTVGASVGAVLADPDALSLALGGGDLGDRLLAAADDAMYVAKRSGRGRWVLADALAG